MVNGHLPPFLVRKCKQAKRKRENINCGWLYSNKQDQIHTSLLKLGGEILCQEPFTFDCFEFEELKAFFTAL